MPELELEFIPRKQFRPYLTRDKRWSCIVAHRRAGKTVACIMDLVIRAVEHKGSDPRFAYIAPTYTQAKDVAWTYLKEYTQAIPGIKYSETELSVTFPHNQSRIRLYGAENYDRLRGLYLDGVVIDEAGDIDPVAWPQVIRPSLSDRKGWATFIGSAKGRNYFHRIHLNAKKDGSWFCGVLKASATGIIDDAELADAKQAMTPEEYAQEYECSFDAAIKGAFYGKDVAEAETEKRIGRVPRDKAADVFCSWDLGIGDNMALWVFQIVGREWHFIKYYENSSYGLDHYVDWIKALPYTVHEHFLPHDAEARELQTGKSRVAFLEERGLNCTVVPRGNVDDGISAARQRFNRFWFDADGCERGIDCLRMYRSEFDEKHGVLKSRPLHDWASHGADAFRCAVMGANDDRATDQIIQPSQNWVI